MVKPKKQEFYERVYDRISRARDGLRRYIPSRTMTRLHLSSLKIVFHAALRRREHRTANRIIRIVFDASLFHPCADMLKESLKMMTCLRANLW